MSILRMNGGGGPQRPACMKQENRYRVWPMPRAMITGAKVILRRFGWEVRRVRRPDPNPPDLNPMLPPLADEPMWVHDIVERVRPYTMTPAERVASLCHAVEYVTQKRLPGDVVECGVWRG
jgi:Macrocin-O-methyltransferase (TylF)